jgi:hypothetical protein
MSALTQRLLALVVLTTAGFTLNGGTASAAEPAGLVTKGIYDGLWHGDKVKFIVEKVSPDGKFSGVIHFDPKGRWPDTKSGFTGQLGPRDSIIIRRPDSTQESTARGPKREGKFWIWTGQTTGKGLDKGFPFEMQIPHR